MIEIYVSPRAVARIDRCSQSHMHVYTELYIMGIEKHFRQIHMLLKKSSNS